MDVVTCGALSLGDIDDVATDTGKGGLDDVKDPHGETRHEGIWRPSNDST